MLRFGGYLLWFYGKDCKTSLAKIIAHLTNTSPSKKRFSNQLIRFPGSNLDSGEIKGNVIGLVHSKDLTAWARGLLPTSTTRSDAPHCWRARRPLASRVPVTLLEAKLSLTPTTHELLILLGNLDQTATWTWELIHLPNIQPLTRKENVERRKRYPNLDQTALTWTIIQLLRRKQNVKHQKKYPKHPRRKLERT